MYETRHQIPQRERVKVDYVPKATPRRSVTRTGEVEHDFDELTFEVRVLHVRCREEDEHEGHEFVLRGLFEDLRGVTGGLKGEVSEGVGVGEGGKKGRTEK
jgi:hypothetical protein